MYEKLQILYPLVEAREFFFMRYCRQLDATTWIMVDVSYDIFNEIQSGAPCYSLKFQTGCAIQDMGNDQSKDGESFFDILSMTVDFPTSSQLNCGDRISIRKNEEITQPKGFIAIAASSLWLPLSFQDVFNFFKDNKTRNQPYNMHKEMLVLEETSTDEMGAFLVYAPIELCTYRVTNNHFNYH
uniref:HD-Zip IV C-terminal domain-containing protein n=1 Tax=Solanum lycopersicum TaxID=4081 RepID=K4CTJ8_SOLLC